jgi:hypothetical protein
MSFQSIYPTDFTDQEKELGFQKVLIQNPDGLRTLGVPNLLVAVVYVLGPGARIEKIGSPGVGISYSHQAYGEKATRDYSAWSPVLVPFESPEEAIRVAKLRVDAEMARQQGLGIDPSMPSIAMRCADCGHSYRLRADHLALEDPVTCPNCKQTRRAREAATIEIRPGPGGIKWASDRGML